MDKICICVYYQEYLMQPNYGYCSMRCIITWGWTVTIDVATRLIAGK